MKNRSLDRYLDAGRNTPSLMSPEDARSLVEGSPTAAETSTDGGIGGMIGNFAGPVTAIVAAAGLIVTILLVDLDGTQSTPEAIAESRPAVVAPDGTSAVAAPEDLIRAPADPVATSDAADNGADRVVAGASGPVGNSPRVVRSNGAVSTTDDLSEEIFASAETDVLNPEDELAASPSTTSNDLTTTTPTPLQVRASIAPRPELLSLSAPIRVTQLEEISIPGIDDYNPVVSSDGRTLYFASNSVNGLGGHDIWQAKIGPDGRLSAPTNLGSGVNSTKHEGGMAISADGSRLFYTSCHRPDGLGDCDIYEARRLDGGEWQTLGNIRTINTGDWEGNPTLTPDGQTLYFVSNRRGAISSSMDIWRSDRDPTTGEWSAPVNLGETVNTSDDEDSPFVTVDGSTLYFSSEGRDIGIGGFDFYRGQIAADGSVASIENLGSGINSPSDERFLAVAPSGVGLYFARASTRGDYDLWSAEEKRGVESTFLAGTIRGVERFDYIRADLLLVDRSTEQIVARTRIDGAGRFRLDFLEQSAHSGRSLELRATDDSGRVFHAPIDLPPSGTASGYDVTITVVGSESP